ncbi:MAG: universal stress protein [Myxococcaceae bacterium]|nr:universal stress protein [Myxococcaceae bacterium]MCI0671601.1 universal stress protein [Myxococcaceae bacterium]
MLKHILVAVDGSEGSHKALAFAASLAKSLGAKLTLLAVLEPPVMLPFAPMESFAVVPTISQEHLEAMRKMLREAAAGAAQMPVDEVVEVGRPSEVICQQAKALGADLIVMGARGTGAHGARWLVGSVSDRVIHTCERPVTIVH